MRQDVQEIISQISALQTQLDAIRASCSHPSYEIVGYAWRLGALDPARLCEDCGAVVPGITEKEISDFWEKYDLSRNLSFEFDQQEEI